MDSQRPEIAGQAGDLLISLHLDLSGHLEREQAVVRSSLIRCATPACSAAAAKRLCEAQHQWVDR